MGKILVIAEHQDGKLNAATARTVSAASAVRAENAHPLAAILAPQIAKAAGGYSHVFLPSTTFGKDVAPRVAALLGVAQVSELMSVESAHVFKRPMYAGNAI